MKITKVELKKIIKEELAEVYRDRDPSEMEPEEYLELPPPEDYEKDLSQEDMAIALGHDAVAEVLNIKQIRELPDEVLKKLAKRIESIVRDALLGEL